MNVPFKNKTSVTMPGIATSIVIGFKGKINLPPEAPSLLIASVISTSAIDLTWTLNSTNEDGISIERSIDGINYSEIDTVAPGIKSYSNTGLISYGIYYYRIRTYKGSLYSDYSNIAKDTTWENISINYSSRSALSLIDEIGANNATLKPFALKLNGANDYFTYNDSGALDIGTGNLTIGFRGGIYEERSPVADEIMFGKCVLNGVLQGSYGFWFNKTTKVIGFILMASGGFINVSSTVGVGSYNFFLVEINHTADTVKLFVDGVQQGGTVSFSGTTNSPNKPVKVAVGESYNSSSLDRPASMIVGEAFIYKTLLTDEQKADLQNGVHVAGAGLHWIFNNVLYAYDVSGNNLDKAVTHITGSTIALSYEGGSPYPYQNGYTLYRYEDATLPDTDLILVPAVNGTFRDSPLILGNFDKFNKVDGGNYVNHFWGGVVFPNGVMDKSDVVKFNATCRAASYYNAAIPTLWDMREFQYDLYKTYLNTDQNFTFFKYDTSAIIGRKTLQNILIYSASKGGENLEMIEKFVNVYNLASKLLIKNTRPEWEACSYYFNGKHYRVWSKGEEDNWDKYIYTIDEDMVISDSYLCANGCVATTDYHSMPSVCVDDSGYIYVIHEQMTGGAHGTDMLLFKSNNPEDIVSGFTQVYELTGQFAYPKLFKVNGDIFCSFRNQDGEDIVIYQLNGSDELISIGILYDAIAGASYSAPLRNETEDKIGMIMYEIDGGESAAVYYAESTDGIIWNNGQGDASINLSTGGKINGTNRESFIVHEDSVDYNSIVSENGLMLNGVPYIVIYEGNSPPGDFTIEVENLYIAKMVNGAWVKYSITETMPLDYAQRAGFNHCLTYKNGQYYMFFVSGFYDSDLLDNSNIKIYKSTDFITWSDVSLTEANYAYYFSPVIWLTINAPEMNQLVWFFQDVYGFYGTMTTLPYTQHLIYKI